MFGVSTVILQYLLSVQNSHDHDHPIWDQFQLLVQQDGNHLALACESGPPQTLHPRKQEITTDCNKLQANFHQYPPITFSTKKNIHQ